MTMLIFLHEEITCELDDEGSQKKGGRKITRKANIYARPNQPKIHIPLNGDGQPVGPDATEFANFIDFGEEAYTTCKVRLVRC